MKTLQINTQGNTRLVILTDKYAIKITRIRPIFAFQRVYLILAGILVKTPDQKGRNLLRIFLGYMFAGIMANIREATYTKNDSQDNRIFPCLFSIFGLLVVQERGKEINEEELITGSLWLSQNLVADLERSEQFCRHPDDNKIRICDYGRRETIQLLQQSNWG